MPLKTVYASGAAFQNENNKGKLYVTDTGMVENLNAAMLGGASRANFVEQGSEKGLTQSGKVLSATGVSASVASSALSFTGSNIKLDSTSTLRVGGIEIVASGNNGILFGIAGN